MFKFLNKKKMKGQSTLEYAVLIIIVIGALLSIQVYIKRGIQGRLKSATDDIGDQYSPGNSNVTMRTHVASNTRDTFAAGVTNSVLLNEEVTDTDMNMFTPDGGSEFWGSAEDAQ
jgi:hypothetical protein